MGLSWSFVTPGMASLQHLRIIATSSFRHRYDDELTRMSFNRVECVERCRVLNMPDMPFPTELVNGNLDLLANLLMLGLVPVTVAPQLSEELERRSLARGIVTLEQMTRKADPSHRLRMKKPSVIEIASKLKPLHHLLHTGAPHAFRIGHVGLIIESGVVVGGAAYDAVYDPQNLMSNVKRRSKLAAASTVGGLVAGGLSLLIPIPGLFIPVSMAGSVAARWIAGKFITEDGKELKDVVPVGRLREDEEGVLEVVQEMEEDDPKVIAVAGSDPRSLLITLLAVEDLFQQGAGPLRGAAGLAFEHKSDAGPRRQARAALHERGAQRMGDAGVEQDEPRNICARHHGSPAANWRFAGICGGGGSRGAPLTAGAAR